MGNFANVDSTAISFPHSYVTMNLTSSNVSAMMTFFNRKFTVLQRTQDEGEISTTTTPVAEYHQHSIVVVMLLKVWATSDRKHDHVSSVDHVEQPYKTHQISHQNHRGLDARALSTLNRGLKSLTQGSCWPDPSAGTG